MSGVWVELGDEGKVIRIFRSRKLAVASPAANRNRIAEMPRVQAVGDIRQQIIKRAGNCCERCGAVLNELIGEMHETVPRGKGGQVSLDNCEWLCFDCHQGRPDSAHGDRRWGGRNVDSKM